MTDAMLHRAFTGGDPVKDAPRRTDLTIQAIDKVIVEVAVLDRVLAYRCRLKPRTDCLSFDCRDDVRTIHAETLEYCLSLGKMGR
jgi:hypothetical protein